MFSTLRIDFVTDAKQLKSIVHRTIGFTPTSNICHQIHSLREIHEKALTPSTKKKRESYVNEHQTRFLSLC